MTSGLAAGEFAVWAEEFRSALGGGQDSDVPCDGCTACCTSSQFVHIGPDETETLGRIPPALLFPAPLLPKGHVVLGYDEHGHCPMLVNNRCSIYEHRPQTCRAYDCRVLAAAGVMPEEPAKTRIRQQADRWRFSYARPSSTRQHDAVRAAADFLRLHANDLPQGMVPSNTAQLAVLAFVVHELFVPDTSGGAASIGLTEFTGPDVASVRAVIERVSGAPA